jgi:hypothetical protein
VSSAISPDRLDGAANSDEIVAAVRGFMTELTTGGLDRLPRNGRPVNVVDAESVDSWAERLGQYEGPQSQDPINRALLERVREYFSRASRRLAEVRPA